jgi:hypothetical protein
LRKNAGRKHHVERAGNGWRWSGLGCLDRSANFARRGFDAEPAVECWRQARQINRGVAMESVQPGNVLSMNPPRQCRGVDVDQMNIRESPGQ